MQEQALRFVPVESCDALRAVFAEQRLIHLARFDRLGGISHELAVRIDEASTISQQETRPHRHVRILEATAHEAGSALGRVVELGGRVDHLGERLRKCDALRVEQLLVVINDPWIEIERKAHHAPVRFDRVVQAALRKITEIELGRGERLVVDHRPQIRQPIVLRELALLNVIRKCDHIEARIARVELDHRFLALLLFGNHLGADADSGEILEFLVVFGEKITAWTFHEKDLDLLAFEFLPVESALPMSEPNGAGNRAEHRRADSRLQQPASLVVGVVNEICHGSSLD